MERTAAPSDAGGTEEEAVATATVRRATEEEEEERQAAAPEAPATPVEFRPTEFTPENAARVEELEGKQRLRGGEERELHELRVKRGMANRDPSRLAQAAAPEAPATPVEFRPTEFTPENAARVEELEGKQRLRSSEERELHELRVKRGMANRDPNRLAQAAAPEAPATPVEFRPTEFTPENAARVEELEGKQRLRGGEERELHELRVKRGMANRDPSRLAQAAAPEAPATPVEFRPTEFTPENAARVEELEGKQRLRSSEERELHELRVKRGMANRDPNRLAQAAAPEAPATPVEFRPTEFTPENAARVEELEGKQRLRSSEERELHELRVKRGMANRDPNRLAQAAAPEAPATPVEFRPTEFTPENAARVEELEGKQRLRGGEERELHELRVKRGMANRDPSRLAQAAAPGTGTTRETLTAETTVPTGETTPATGSADGPRRQPPPAGKSRRRTPSTSMTAASRKSRASGSATGATGKPSATSAIYTCPCGSSGANSGKKWPMNGLVTSCTNSRRPANTMPRWQDGPKPSAG